MGVKDYLKTVEARGLGAALNKGKPKFAPDHTVKHTQSQMRVIQNSAIDADSKLTPAQKKKQKSQIQYDDLPKYTIRQV